MDKHLLDDKTHIQKYLFDKKNFTKEKIYAIMYCEAVYCVKTRAPSLSSANQKEREKR